MCFVLPIWERGRSDDLHGPFGRQAALAELAPSPGQPTDERGSEPEGPREHEQAVPPNGDRKAARMGKDFVRMRLVPLQGESAGAVAVDEHLRVAEETA